MAYTQADLEAVEKAIASGTMRVKYQDKEVEYRSLTDLERIKATISDALGLNDEGPIPRVVGIYNSGL